MKTTPIGRHFMAGHGRRLARVASPMLVSLVLGACSGLFDSGVEIALGTPRLAPAEVNIAADATARSPAIGVLVELPYRYTNNQSNAPSARLNLVRVDEMPAGLWLQPGNLSDPEPGDDEDPLLVNDASVDRNEAGRVQVPLKVFIRSDSPIGMVSPGRHNVALRAELCVFILDLSVGTDDKVCDVETVELVIVVGGAPAPSAPAGLAATPGPRTVGLNWRADPAPDRYLLERAITGAAFANVATLTAPVTTYLDSGLEPATRYTYRLTPRNAAGSGPAATIDVQTLAEAANGQLAVVVTGSGVGRVTSTPAGIDCPGDCNEAYPLGSSVTLNATPGAGSVFDGWSGPADCADGVVTVVAELACTANFSLAASGVRGWTLIGELLASGGEAPLVSPPGAGGLHVALRRVDAASGYRELVVLRQGPQGWAVLGGGAPNGIASATSHGLVVDSAGRPYVAWSEASAVRVARFENGVWTRLADNLRIGNGTPSQVQFEWRSLQPPVLSWIETDAGIARVAVKRLALDLSLGNQAWIGGYVPDIPNPVGHRMALDSNGLPSFVLSRLNVSLQQPLVAWRVSAIADGAVQAEPLGGDITISTGIAYQHEQQGYGIGFVLNVDGTSGAPLVLGTRDTRWAYAKAFNGLTWVQGGQINRVLDADGVVFDAGFARGEVVLGVATLRTPGIGLLFGVLSVSNATPDRIELLSLDGLAWIRPADPLLVTNLQAVGSGSYDSANRPVVLTVEGFGAGGRGRIRAYQFNP